MTRHGLRTSQSGTGTVCSQLHSSIPKSAADADDMAQIALIKCYHAEKPFENEQHIRNWLIRVTVNECKRYLGIPTAAVYRADRGLRGDARL